jgi:hypothetical protein
MWIETWTLASQWMNFIHLFTRHVIHEHGIEISIMLKLLKTIVTNNLMTWG